MWLTYFDQYLQQTLPRFLSQSRWNYKDDLCVVGANDLYEATGDARWLRPILAVAHHLIGEDGSIRNWTSGEHNADKISFGKSLRILRDLTGDARYADAAARCYALLSDYPRTHTGNFWHKDIYPNQVWLDGLYMIQPFYAACLKENGQDRWDDIFDQFVRAHDLLWDESLGLYRHGNDCSRAMSWADPVTGQSPAVWLRAEGWFLMALCDVYELAQGHPRAPELAALLEHAVRHLLPYQQPESRMFLQVVDRADLPGNYPETSGSAMVAYALMKGARLGMLPRAYWQAGSDIIDGIRSTCLRQEADGLHLHGICASAGLGEGPDPHNLKNRDGTPEYYLRERRVTDNEHGTAACMMAVSEQLRGAAR